MSKDLTTIDSPNPGKGQFLVYEAEDGRVKIDVRLGLLVNFGHYPKATVERE